MSTLGPIHTNTIKSGLEYFEDIREESLLAAKQTWTTSVNSVRNREPFGYRNFTEATTRLTCYGNLVLSEGPTWIGCCYKIPIIWYPPDGYRCNYELSEHQEGRAFVVLKNKKMVFGSTRKKHVVPIL